MINFIGLVLFTIGFGLDLILLFAVQFRCLSKEQTLNYFLLALVFTLVGTIGVFMVFWPGLKTH